MSGWRSLRAHCKDAHRYSLLIKYDIGQSRYTIWLTDLTYLWRESLDQIQIQERASHLNTSIDGQDPDQMDLILRRIADALDNKEGTRVELFSNGGEKRLTLNTSTPLPRPLKPLDWSIMLMPAPQSMMTREFFLPLLNQQFTSKVEKASLVQYLKEKDGVIGRLSDKMLSDGVDLSMVFPGAASSKAGTNPNARQLLSVYIKGLAEFDQELWETRFTNRSGSRSLEDVISQVFSGSLKSPYSLSLPNSGDWWTRLSRRSSESTEFASNERNIPSPEIADEEGFVVEDGFQVGLRCYPLDAQREKLIQIRDHRNLDFIFPNPGISPRPSLRKRKRKKSTIIFKSMMTRLQTKVMENFDPLQPRVTCKQADRRKPTFRQVKLGLPSRP